MFRSRSLWLLLGLALAGGFAWHRYVLKTATIDDVARFQFMADAWAQGPGGPGGGGGGGGPMGGPERKLVKQFDKDGDDRLNNAERQAAREFLKKEPQGGGRGGFGPGGPGGRGGRGFGPSMFLMQPLLAAVDGDKDAKLTLAELTDGATRLFKEADADKKGSLAEPQVVETLNRILPRPPFGGPGAGGPGGGGPGAAPGGGPPQGGGPGRGQGTPGGGGFGPGSGGGTSGPCLSCWPACCSLPSRCCTCRSCAGVGGPRWAATATRSSDRPTPRRARSGRG